MRWDVWDPVGAKTIGVDSCFCSNVSCDMDGGGIPSGHGALLLYWGDMLEFTVGSSVSELDIWQFLIS